ATAKHLGESEHFAVTYGDGLTDVDLAKEFSFHEAHGRIGTVMGVNPPSRFGEFKLEDDRVVEFEEKPSFDDRWINGGFFFFRKGFTSYLSADESCILERAPLGKLARDSELSVYKHHGYWACMDTQRDYEELNKLWDSGKAPWAS
ncbi:MAG: sugar phosphate nucleotidyltransferase, partial [Planctomycetota bacterium]